jgi:hypothetical protein
LKPILILCFLFNFSNTLFALTIPPLKIIPDTKEYQIALAKKDLDQLRLIASQKTAMYYDDFVTSYKLLNHVSEDPLPANTKNDILTWVKEAPIDFFEKSAEERWTLGYTHYVELINQKLIPEESPDFEAAEKRADKIFYFTIVALVIVVGAVFTYKKYTNKL